MAGEPIADAMRAARAFAARRNPSRRSASIFFNDERRRSRCRPTRDQAEIQTRSRASPRARRRRRTSTTRSRWRPTSSRAAGASARCGRAAHRRRRRRQQRDAGGRRSSASRTQDCARLRGRPALRAYTPDDLQTLAAETGGAYAETGAVAELDRRSSTRSASGSRTSTSCSAARSRGPRRTINVAVRVAGYPGGRPRRTRRRALGLADRAARASRSSTG